jgi:hypothetical protein
VRAVAVVGDGGRGVVLAFGQMMAVSGPYVGRASPVRGIEGSGFPWVLTAGTGSLDCDGHLVVRVRGLVLAGQPAVPARLRGTNPFPAFRAVVSCRSIGAGDMAAAANISTGDFAASACGDLEIDARVALPRPCIAPVVFITGPSGAGAWLAVTGG